MKRLNYYIVRFAVNLVWLTPFPVLYFFSDIIRLLLQHVIRYRRKTIWNNLRKSFPEKNHTELRAIFNDCYINLADILIEGIKGLRMTEAELQSRYPFYNKAILTTYLEKNQSVIAVNAHFSNWEWAVLGYGYKFPNKSIGIYKTIQNEYINEYVNELRAKSSIQLLSTRETRMVADEMPKGKILVLMGDQNPSNIKDAIWVTFFGRDTACLHGIEKYSRQYNLPVVFAEIKRIQRGHYQLQFEKLVENPNELEYGAITQLYMSRCEKNILLHPGDWLWSHKRWKHVRK
jgi:KDO2-lipid IV(A) lauroyltransferase